MSGCSGPFVAEAPGELPTPGPGQTVAGVSLPSGGQGPGGPRYWISHAPADDAANLWRELALAFADTGLWPVLSDFPSELSFDAFGVSIPDELDAASLLSRSWTEGSGFDDGVVAAFGESFPGLAAHQSTCVHPIAESIADVIAALDAWISFEFDPGEVTAILRSWEERFGIYPMSMDWDALALGIERPPKPGADMDRF
jgi:hypothetical protein